MGSIQPVLPARWHPDAEHARGVMAIRRPLTPTATDLWLLRWGFVPLWLAAQMGVRYAWCWMGRL